MSETDSTPGRHFHSPVTTSRARSLRSDMTFPEKILWALLRGGRLGGLKFRRQHPIGRYVADFYCDSAKLVVELDGMTHVGTGAADDRRTKELEAQGIRVNRFTNDEVLADRIIVAEAIARAAGVELKS